MSKLHRLGCFLGILALMTGFRLVSGAPAMAQTVSPSYDDVAGRLVCQCGCGSVLNNCVHQECMERDDMKSAIGTALKQGKSPDEIVASFVSKYGEQVLAAPTKKGFNLTAWMTPFLAIVVGGVAIFFILKAWVLKGAEKKPAPIPASPQARRPEEDIGYRKQVEAELKRYGDGLQ